MRYCAGVKRVTISVDDDVFGRVTEIRGWALQQKAKDLTWSKVVDFALREAFLGKKVSLEDVMRPPEETK